MLADATVVPVSDWSRTVLDTVSEFTAVVRRTKRVPSQAMSLPTHRSPSSKVNRVVRPSCEPFDGSIAANTTLEESGANTMPRRLGDAAATA